MGQMVGNPKVTVIPARPRMGIGRKNDERQKIRVAAYCRVSTDSDEQATSYEAQIEHYTAFIKKNPDWEFAGIFADDGISGTDTRKREEFNRMIEECMKGKIQMVITKSISRFARNTLDCLKYIRQLKDRGIPVFFEKENINTMDAKGEVMLNHYGVFGTAGKRVIEPEREDRPTVPLPAGACTGQPQPFPRIYERR